MSSLLRKDEMDTRTFDAVVDMQLLDCLQTLRNKAEEYATDGDRLHNFKVAAHLQHVMPRRALSGMMAKHVISIFDMCASDAEYSDALWNEKIKDTINYCLLLKAIIQEEKQKEQPKQLPLDGIIQEPLVFGDLNSLQRRLWVNQGSSSKEATDALRKFHP